MRSHLILAVLALMGILFSASEVIASGIVLNAACDQLGATAMADDHTAILLCTFPAPNAATTCASGGGCVWKPIGGGGGACYVSYKNDATDAACMAGFHNKGSVGKWGYCHMNPMGQSSGVVLQGAACPSGYYQDSGFYDAYLCCQ